jgi:hypothetical protein
VTNQKQAECSEVIAALHDVLHDYGKGERGRPIEAFMLEPDG